MHFYIVYNIQYSSKLIDKAANDNNTYKKFNYRPTSMFVKIKQVDHARTNVL